MQLVLECLVQRGVNGSYHARDFLGMHHIVSGVGVPQNAFLVEPFIQKIKVRFKNSTEETTLQELDVGFRN